jgi:hypothetical protein
MENLANNIIIINTILGNYHISGFEKQYEKNKESGLYKYIITLYLNDGKLKIVAYDEINYIKKYGYENFQNAFYYIKLNYSYKQNKIFIQNCKII